MQNQSQIEELTMWEKYTVWLHIQATFMNDQAAAKLLRYFSHRFQGMN